LLHRTPLRAQNYLYCMTYGNDARGINSALLYQRDKFRHIGHQAGRIRFTNRGKRSRDVLHVWGEVITGDTLDVFVCHFPSRYGGEKETLQDRMDAAGYVRRMCDSLCRSRMRPNILVMGDFNDTPADPSIQVLTQSPHPEWILTNLFAGKMRSGMEGSHKYQGEWTQLDQMMISLTWKGFLDEGSARVFDSPFLLIDDKSKRGKRPWRSYYGFKYEGGFSDHLPIVADFLLPLPD